MTEITTPRKRLSFDEKLTQLSKRRADIDARLRKLTQQHSVNDRKQATHRKILVGVALLAEVAEVNGGAWLADLLRRRLTARDLAHPSVADLLLAHGTAPQSQAQSPQQGEAGENG